MTREVGDKHCDSTIGKMPELSQDKTARPKLYYTDKILGDKLKVCKEQDILKLKAQIIVRRILEITTKHPDWKVIIFANGSSLIKEYQQELLEQSGEIRNIISKDKVTTISFKELGKVDDKSIVEPKNQITIIACGDIKKTRIIGANAVFVDSPHKRIRRP